MVVVHSEPPFCMMMRSCGPSTRGAPPSWSTSSHLPIPSASTVPERRHELPILAAGRSPPSVRKLQRGLGAKFALRPDVSVPHQRATAARAPDHVSPSWSTNRHLPTVLEVLGAWLKIFSLATEQTLQLITMASHGKAPLRSCMNTTCCEMVCGGQCNNVATALLGERLRGQS